METLKASKWICIFVVSVTLLGYFVQENSAIHIVPTEKDQGTLHPYSGLDQKVDIENNEGKKIDEATLEPMDHNEITYCIERKYSDGGENLSDERYKEFKGAIESALNQWTDLKICLDKKEIKFKEVGCDKKPDLVFKPVHNLTSINPKAPENAAGYSRFTCKRQKENNAWRAWVNNSDVYIDTDQWGNAEEEFSEEQICSLIRHEIGHAVFGLNDLYKASVPKDLKDSTFIQEEATERKGFSKWDKEELKTRFPCPAKPTETPEQTKTSSRIEKPQGHDPPIYENIMVFPTREYHLGLDLNNDGDINDTILRYQNLKTGKVVNTGLIASGAYHSMDIYENIITFVGKDSHICYYDINTGAVSDIGITGFYPSIYDNIIAFISQGTIHYFNLITQTLTNTEIKGNNPAIYQNLIVFHTSPEFMIWVYDLRTGDVVNTGIIGRNATLYETVVAFVTPEFKVAEDLNGDGDTNDLVIQYYNLETKTITNTGAVGRYPSIYGNRIVFTTEERTANQDLNGDGKILGNVIRYFDLKTGHVINTRQLGTEPDIFEDTITFYLWERWTGQDLSGDGDQSDPIVDTFQITMTEMSITGPDVWLFLALLVIGGITAYLKRK